MRLLKYYMEVPATVGTMDRYFHIMFKKQFPNINSSGEITEQKLLENTLGKLEEKLSELSKDHDPVSWLVVVKYRNKTYEIISKNGKVVRNNVRFIDNGGG